MNQRIKYGMFAMPYEDKPLAQCYDEDLESLLSRC